MSSTSNDPSLSEWQTARDVLNSYDDRLHDLHKVGFSFITGLLTVDALLANIPDNWKLAALVATLFLIVPLDLIDRNYRVFTTAASIRAQIIERRSLMDLTQTITRMFEIAHVAYFFEIVYVLFALAVLLLGWIIFVPNLPDTYAKLAYWAPVVIFAISTVVAARLELKNLRSGLQKFLIKIAIAILPLSAWLLTPLILSLENSCWLLGIPTPTACSMIHGYRTLIISVAISVASILYIETAVNLNEWVDFSIDGYDYKRRKPVLITVGNLGYENLKLAQGAWEIYKESDPYEPLASAPKPVRSPMSLPARSTVPGKVGWSEQRWQVSTAALPPGLYRAVYKGPVYFRTGIFGRFQLLDANKPEQKEKLTNLGYDPWNDSVQRFQIL